MDLLADTVGGVDLVHTIEMLLPHSGVAFRSLLSTDQTNKRSNGNILEIVSGSCAFGEPSNRCPSTKSHHGDDGIDDKNNEKKNDTSSDTVQL